MSERHNDTNSSPQSPESLIDDQDIDLVIQAQKELPYRTHAYQKLVSKYHALIFHICFKMLANRDDAEDITQEVLLKIFNYLPKFEKRSTFKTWISRITTNTCISAQDKLKRNRELKGMLTTDPSYYKQETRIDTTKRDLDIALQLLAPKERQILTLRYTANLKIEEIADVLDQGLSATKMRLYRAQEALKDKMEAYQN